MTDSNNLKEEAKPLFALANDFFRNGRFEAAAEYYQRAIELDPTFDKAYYNLGITFNKLGESDKAVRFLKTAAQLNHQGAIDILKNNGLL